MTGAVTRLVGIGLIVAGAALAAPVARADYPDKTVKIMLGFAAGGGADILARWYADKLQQTTGATFIVENKVGASGNLALDATAKARPDGHTLLFASTVTTAGNTHVFKNLPVDVTKDLVPITYFGETPFVLVVAPHSPINSVADLTAHIRSKGGKATFGWATTSAIASTALYLASAGVEATPVGYKATATAVTDVTAGQIDFAFADIVFATGQARQGRVKILAVTSEERSPGLPDVPSLKDYGVPTGEITPLWGVWAPARTPREVIDKLAKWVNDITAMPATREFLIMQGATPKIGSPEDYRKRFETAMKAWSRAVSIAKIEPQ